jgi:hypothetical protein
VSFVLYAGYGLQGWHVQFRELERLADRIKTLRDFCDGLEYIQFEESDADQRMLVTVEWEGAGLFQWVNNCLSREALQLNKPMNRLRTVTAVAARFARCDCNVNSTIIIQPSRITYVSSS